MYIRMMEKRNQHGLTLEVGRGNQGLRYYNKLECICWNIKLCIHVHVIDTIL